MKTIIAAVISIIITLSLMIYAPTVYAETAYQSGSKHGVTDATADKALTATIQKYLILSAKMTT